MIPLYGAFTTYTPALQNAYWDVYSSEQRIKYIFCEIDKISQYLDTVTDSVNAALDEQDRENAETLATVRKELAALKTDLTAMVEALTVGQNQWNVQHGEYTDTVSAQRDMFNDLTVHAITVGTLNTLDYTVATLANCGLNVRGLAVYSGVLTDGDFNPEDIYDTNSYEAKRLTVDELSHAVVSEDFYVKTK